MGLFDGAYPDSIAGSSAEIALWLNSPVILVTDVYGMAGSIAALVKGFTTFHEGVHIAGVIANACGSRRHAELVERSLDNSGVSRLVGAIEKGGLPPCRVATWDWLQRTPRIFRLCSSTTWPMPWSARFPSMISCGSPTAPVCFPLGIIRTSPKKGCRDHHAKRR